jgi:hypothetical protein
MKKDYKMEISILIIGLIAMSALAFILLALNSTPAQPIVSDPTININVMDYQSSTNLNSRTYIYRCPITEDNIEYSDFDYVKYLTGSISFDPEANYIYLFKFTYSGYTERFGITKDGIFDIQYIEPGNNTILLLKENDEFSSIAISKYEECSSNMIATDKPYWNIYVRSLNGTHLSQEGFMSYYNPVVEQYKCLILKIEYNTSTILIDSAKLTSTFENERSIENTYLYIQIQNITIFDEVMFSIKLSNFDTVSVVNWSVYIGYIDSVYISIDKEEVSSGSEGESDSKLITTVFDFSEVVFYNSTEEVCIMTVMDEFNVQYNTIIGSSYEEIMLLYDEENPEDFSFIDGKMCEINQGMYSSILNQPDIQFTYLIGIDDHIYFNEFKFDIEIENDPEGYYDIGGANNVGSIGVELEENNIIQFLEIHHNGESYGSTILLTINGVEYTYEIP